MRREKRNKLLQEISEKEPYRIMANRVQQYKAEGKSCIAFTSHEKEQGKSYIIQEVALTLARSGYRVLLVDCHLFSGTLTTVLRHSEHLGVIDALESISEQAEENLALQYTHGIEENLYFMPKGGGIQTIAYEKVIKSEYLSAMFKNLKPSFDYILVEGPSFEYFSYTQNILAAMDGCILVLKAGALGIAGATALKEQLDHIGCTVLSCILNQKEDTTCKVSRVKRGTKKEHKQKVETHTVVGEGVMM